MIPNVYRLLILVCTVILMSASSGTGEEFSHWDNRYLQEILCPFEDRDYSLIPDPDSYKFDCLNKTYNSENAENYTFKENEKFSLMNESF